MKWTAKAVDSDHDRFIVEGDNGEVGVASIIDQRITVLHVVKYAPLGHGEWLDLTPEDRARFGDAVADMSVIDGITGELLD